MPTTTTLTEQDSDVQELQRFASRRLEPIAKSAGRSGEAVGPRQLVRAADADAADDLAEVAGQTRGVAGPGFGKVGGETHETVRIRVADETPPRITGNGTGVKRPDHDVELDTRAASAGAGTTAPPSPTSARSKALNVKSGRCVAR